jgi:peroxiredoxin
MESGGAALTFKDEAMKKYVFMRAIVVIWFVSGTTVAANAQQTVQADNPEYVRLIDRLGQIGERLVKTDRSDEMFGLSWEQVNTLDRLIAMARPEERDGWYRQLSECLVSAATQSPKNDLRAINRLAGLRADLDRVAPSSALTAYVAYQQLQADHAQLANVSNADTASVQQSWRHLLANYVNAYPHASETSHALVELATLCEAAGKDEDARRCYRFMLENHPDKADLEKAAGALNRLNLTGQEFHLALPLLKEDTFNDEPFDLGSLKGKVVVVYFWAASNEQCIEDMHRLSNIVANIGSQRCQLVCVNCDVNPADALRVVHEQRLDVVQLHQRKGLEGLVSHRFGLFEVPHVIVVGRDGFVISKSAELTTLKQVVAAHLEDPVPEVIKPSSRMSTSRWLTIGK